MLKIKRVGNLLYIIEQDIADDWFPYIASNGIRIQSINCPFADYGAHNELITLYLRGNSKEQNNRPLHFLNMADLHKAVKALKEFCYTIGCTFKIEPERIKLK